MEHVWYKCGDECSGCQICDGGLAACTVCGGFEGTLLHECPGVSLAQESLDAIYAGKIVSLHYAREVKKYCIKEGIQFPPKWHWW